MAGKTPIGTAQDLTPVYPPKGSDPAKQMTNHIHVQVTNKKGQVVDPTGTGLLGPGG